MKKNVVIVNCRVPSEAYQMLSLLRQEPRAKGCKVSHAAIVRKDAGKLSLADGFVADSAEGDSGWTGGLIGGLVGLLAGPLGALVGGSVGALIGNSMDREELKGAAKVLEKAGENLVDGDTALVLLAEEKDEAALDEALKAFQVTVTRLDAKEVAAEIEAASKKKGKKKSVEAPCTFKEDGEKQTLILGNFITVDPKRPTAKAAVVKNGVFAYIGDAETAKQLASEKAQKIREQGKRQLQAKYGSCAFYILRVDSYIQIRA